MYVEKAQTVAYRVHVTESLRNMPQGRHVAISYWDMIHPKPADTRTGDEIAADVIERLGLEVT